MITPLGTFKLSVLLPGVVAALALAVPDLQARVDALLAFSPGEIDLTASLSLAESIIADLTAALTLGITPPSIAAQIAIIAGILEGLQANLSAILAFQNLLVSGGVFAYAYDGNINNAGSELGAQLAVDYPGAAGNAHCNALILGTQIGATWTAMGGVFKTS